jgi:hypothetical protein
VAKQGDDGDFGYRWLIEIDQEHKNLGGGIEGETFVLDATTPEGRV